MAYFWSSVEDDPVYAYAMGLNYRVDDVSLGRWNKDYRFSVRCVEDYLEKWR